MQVVDDLVVHRAAELRMRVQDDGNRGVAFGLGMIAAFKAAFGSGKDNLGHLVCLLPFAAVRDNLDEIARTD